MDAPKTFEELDIPPVLRDSILARGLTAPTHVQVLVADPGLVGRDVLVSSQTGSGKTVAFGLLIARELLEPDGQAPRTDAPAALVVAPTRELAVQVERELAWLFEKSRARVLSVTGGTDARGESRRLSQGCEILVATPGRLTDHLRRRNLTLENVRVAVLDEADEMLDMGFREDLEAILQAAPESRRTHMFSATLPPTILKLARTYQTQAVRIAAGAPGAKGHQDIEILCHLYGPGQREAAVVNVLRRHEAPAAIVFTKTRAGTSELASALGKRGFAVTAISGELTQAERTRALASLREGRARVLVATDVAARGLDLPDVGLVIHADLPMESSGLTHRSGRTGRAGRKGISVLLAPRGERAKAERIMRAEGMIAPWSPVPTAEEIETADRERLVAELKEQAREPLPDSETALADRLLHEVPVRELVAALVRRSRASRPPPAEVRPVAAGERGAPEREGRERPGRERPGRERPGREEGRGRPARGGRPDVVRFRVNVGENRNADPRWLLPLICRRGGISGGDVGAIRISPRSTTFEVSADVAQDFEKRATRVDPSDPGVRFERELSREELAARIAQLKGGAPGAGPEREGPARPERPPRFERPERPAPAERYERSAPSDRQTRPAAPRRDRPVRAGAERPSPGPKDRRVRPGDERPAGERVERRKTPVRKTPAPKRRKD